MVLLMKASTSWAYRPFVFTDTAMARINKVEIEAEYFTIARANNMNTYTVPDLVVNYGVIKNVELVGQFGVEKNSHTQLTHPGLFLKTVLREGVLQEKRGVSVAIEAGPLFPSTIRGQDNVGFAGTGIISAKLMPLTFHLNLGGGLEPTRNGIAIWGLITEYTMWSRFRVVSEINGVGFRGRQPAHHSALLGFTWQASSNAVLDGGVRKGFASNWLVTAGLTIAFSLPEPEPVQAQN